MCGIAGFNWNSKEELLLMLEQQTNRGPDNLSYDITDTVSLGHNRLSIIDLDDRSNQPMNDAESDITIVYNGEIYNYLEIKEILISKGFKFSTESDTEVLLKSYKFWGPKFLTKLIGMFSFCIYDKKRNCFFLARDHIGIKPLYYYFKNDKFIFSSTIKAMKVIITDDIKPNEKLIRDFLLYSMTDHTNETLFSGINKLPKASFMIFNLTSNNYKIYKWYNFDFNPSLNNSFISLKSDLKESLSNSVELRLISDVPVGTSLSGGIDSSSIACLIKKSKKAEIKTFSGVFPGFEEDESSYVDIIRKESQMENYQTTPDHKDLIGNLSDFILNLEEPPPTTNPFLQYMVFKLAKDNDVTVMLDGQGADELFAGYQYFFGFYLKGLLFKFRFIDFCKELIGVVKRSDSFISILSLLFLLSPSLIREKFLIKRSLINSDFVKKNHKEKSFGSKYYGCRNLHSALKFHLDYKLEHLLTWEDRNSMAHSIEARVPFLDINVMKVVSNIPEEFIVKSGLTKFILRDSMKGIVPQKILDRNDKIGYKPPDRDWLKSDEIKNIMNNYFLEQNPLCGRYINLNKFRNIINEYNEKDSALIWKMFMLETWFKEFFPNNQ